MVCNKLKSERNHVYCLRVVVKMDHTMFDLRILFLFSYKIILSKLDSEPLSQELLWVKIFVGFAFV